MKHLLLFVLICLLCSSAVDTRRYVVDGYDIRVAPTVEASGIILPVHEVKVVLNKDDQLQQVVVVYGKPEEVKEEQSS